MCQVANSRTAITLRAAGWAVWDPRPHVDRERRGSGGRVDLAIVSSGQWDWRLHLRQVHIDFAKWPIGRGEPPTSAVPAAVTPAGRLLLRVGTAYVPSGQFGAANRRRQQCQRL